MSLMKFMVKDRKDKIICQFEETIIGDRVCDLFKLIVMKNVKFCKYPATNTFLINYFAL